MKSVSPQVALFGSAGTHNWREIYAIPILEELGITYFDPRLNRHWTPADGEREAEVMKQAETIIMYFTSETPGFGGLAETGWAALGCRERDQSFILCIEQSYTLPIAGWWRRVPMVSKLIKSIESASVRTRKLAAEHAKQFVDAVDNLYILDSIEELPDQIRKLYG